MKYALTTLLMLALIAIVPGDTLAQDVEEMDSVTEFNLAKIQTEKAAKYDLWNKLQAQRADVEPSRLRLALAELDKALLDAGGGLLATVLFLREVTRHRGRSRPVPP